MNPEEMQQTQMSPDDAMAALAISTRMSEQMMAQEAPQPEMGEEMATEEETTPKEGQITPETASGGTETQYMANITDEINNGLVEAKKELKNELRDIIKSELKKLMDDDEDNKEDDE